MISLIGIIICDDIADWSGDKDKFVQQAVKWSVRPDHSIQSLFKPKKEKKLEKVNN